MIESWHVFASTCRCIRRHFVGSGAVLSYFFCQFMLVLRTLDRDAAVEKAVAVRPMRLART